MIINIFTNERKARLASYGVKHTQELQETKNWKGLPVPRPRREGLNVTSRSPGQGCCSGSASSHETVQRATNELPLPEEPEGW